MRKEAIDWYRYPLIGVLDAEAWPVYRSVVRAVELYFDGYDAREVERKTGVPAHAVELLCLDAPVEETALNNLRSGSPRDLRKRLEQLTGLSPGIPGNRPRQSVQPRDEIPLEAPNVIKKTKPVFRTQPAASSPSYPVPEDLVGAKRGLLPFESCSSILGRVSSVNRLATGFVPPGRARLSALPFARPLRFDIAPLWASLKWGQSIEGLVTISLPHLAGVLFSEAFRYCPECVAASYHSAYHQLFFVSSCPIHEHPLRSTCPNCDGHVGAYGEILHSGSTQFRCATCAQPLTGEGFSFRKHYDFRDQRAVWSEKFVPISRWLGNCHVSLWGLERIIASNPECVQSWALWTNAIEFLREAILQLHPPPRQSAATLYGGIRVFQWEVVPLFERNTASFLGRPDLGIEHGNACIKSQTRSALVYFGFVEHLHIALCRFIERRQLRISLVEYIDALTEGRAVYTTGADHRLVALATLIFLCEGRKWVLREPGLIGFLTNEALAILSFHNSRVRAEAFLIGLFACIVAAIKREASSHGSISAQWAMPLLSLQTVPIATLPGPSPFGSRVVSGGLVVTPEVDDFLQEICPCI